MRDPGLEAQPVVDGAVAQERDVEGLPVVGDEKVVLAQDPLHLREQRALLGVVAREELAKHEIPLPDVAEPDEKDGLRLEAAGLDVEEEHAAMPELPEEPALGRIERFDRLGERAGRVLTGRVALFGRPTDLLVLLEQGGWTLVQLRVEPLVHEQGALAADHDAAGENVLDRSWYDPRLARAAHGGIKGHGTPTSRSLTPEHLPDALAQRGADHPPEPPPA